jgi:hypothetical protein
MRGAVESALLQRRWVRCRVDASDNQTRSGPIRLISQYRPLAPCAHSGIVDPGEGGVWQGGGTAMMIRVSVNDVADGPTHRAELVLHYKAVSERQVCECLWTACLHCQSTCP